MRALCLFLSIAYSACCYGQQSELFICSFYIQNGSAADEKFNRQVFEDPSEKLTIGSGYATYDSADNAYLGDEKSMIIGRTNMLSSPTIPSGEEGLIVRATSEIMMESEFKIEKGAKVLFEISNQTSASVTVDDEHTETIKNLDETINEHQVSVYPVPAVNLVFIEFEYSGLTSALIQVYDLKGNVLNEQRIQVKKGNNKVPVDVSDMTSGHTLLFNLIFKDNRKEIRGKIIKSDK